jgi:hypothetical protein
MNSDDIDKAYVSPYDKFLAEFDRTHPLSTSQLKEIKTYRRIFALRDGSADSTNPNEIWEKF